MLLSLQLDVGCSELRVWGQPDPQAGISPWLCPCMGRAAGLGSLPSGAGCTSVTPSSGHPVPPWRAGALRPVARMWVLSWLPGQAGACAHHPLRNPPCGQEPEQCSGRAPRMQNPRSTVAFATAAIESISTQPATVGNC